MRAIIRNCRNRVRAVRAPLHGPDEPLHGPEKRGDSPSLTRRRFAGALGAGAVIAVLGMTRCSPGPSDGSGETNPDPRQTNPDLRQTRKVASVDFRIGGYAEDRSDYLFGQVDGLVLLADGRFIVADRHTRRVTMYSDGGLFISQIGGSGEGPGEFDRASVMAVDPSDRLWVFTYGMRQPQEYVVFSLAERSASFVTSVSVEERKTLTSLRPAFGPDGLVGVTVHDVTVHGERLHGRRLWLAENGAVVREHPLPKHATPDELGHRFAQLRGAREGRYLYSVVPPFAPRDWLAQAPSGQYARCVTARYEIDLYNADGERLRQIVRDQLGPQVSTAERRREQFMVDSVKASLPELEYPTVPIADRKPAVKYIWYDDDGRLWVQLWEEHGESVARAHVYDGGGDFLFDAEWPLDVSLTNGAIRGDAAVGVALGRFEVPEIVRMTFYAR